MTTELIYILCAATCLTCFALLLRGYFRSRARLLLWCSAAFFAFSVSNILLVFDMVISPGQGLSMARTLATFLGLVLMMCGLILGT